MSPLEVKALIGVMVLASLSLICAIVQIGLEMREHRRMLQDPAAAVLLSALQLAGIAERARKAMEAEITGGDGSDR